MGLDMDQLAQNSTFVMVPEAVFDADISNAALRVWIALKSFCWCHKRHCYPGIPEIMRAAHQTRRTLERALSELESAGLILRESGRGRKTIFHLRGFEQSSAIIAPSADLALVPNSTQGSAIYAKDPPKVVPNSTKSSAKNDDIKHIKKYIREADEEEADGAELRPPPTSDTTPPTEAQTNPEPTPRPEPVATNAPAQPKPTKKTRPQYHLTREEVEAQVRAIDLTKYATKFPGLDLDDEHAEFMHWVLNGIDLRSGKPQWQKYTAWERTFLNHLRRSAQRIRAPTQQTPSTKTRAELAIERWAQQHEE